MPTTTKETTTVVDTKTIYVITSIADKNDFWVRADNRPINENHVRRLKKAIIEKNMLRTNPIIVTPGHMIIDGQHRWMAIKDEPGVELAYVIAEDYQEDDIIRLNKDQLNWGLTDYAKHYAEKGVKGYSLLLDLKEEYDLPISAVIEVFGGAGTDNSKQFKKGDFKIDLEEGLIDLLDLIRELRKHGFIFAAHLQFIRAMKVALKHDDFFLDEFYDKVFRSSTLFRRQTDRYHYLRMIEDIYNFRKHSHTRLRLT